MFIPNVVALDEYRVIVSVDKGIQTNVKVSHDDIYI